MNKTPYNSISKSLYEESIRKMCVSSLSIPTFLAQSMGYLPFSFNKSSNSLQFKFLSFPMLSLIFHSLLSVTWISFYVLHNIVVISGSPSKRAASATAFSSYLGIMAVATFGTSAIRLYCLIKRKEIISFYEQFKPTVLNVLLHSPKASKELENWRSKMHKESFTTLRITISVAIIFTIYALILVILQFGNVNQELWQWFESFAVLCASIIAALYSALIIWLSQVVYLIRLGFKALEHSQGLKNASDQNKAQNNLKVFWELKLENEVTSDSNGQEFFVRQFLELREMVKTINSVFGLPMIISLGGLTCFGILYTFFFLAMLSNAPFFPLHAFLT